MEDRRPWYPFRKGERGARAHCRWTSSSRTTGVQSCSRMRPKPSSAQAPRATNKRPPARTDIPGVDRAATSPNTPVPGEDARRAALPVQPSPPERRLTKASDRVCTPRPKLPSGRASTSAPTAQIRWTPESGDWSGSPEGFKGATMTSPTVWSRTCRCWSWLRAMSAYGPNREAAGSSSPASTSRP